MQASIWEKHVIERIGSPKEVAWTNPSFHFITQILFEDVKGHKEVVEVVPREIIKKCLVFRRFMVQFSAKLLHSLD